MSNQRHNSCYGTLRYRCCSNLLLLLLLVIGSSTVLPGSEARSSSSSSSTARKPQHPLWKLPLLRQLQGGADVNDVQLSSKDGGSALNDEDLDEYIEFLLAAADGEASESENPLFRTTRRTPGEEAGEETVLLACTTTTTEAATTATTTSTDVDDVVKRIVQQDVPDDEQLDELIDTLVASVSDGDNDKEDEATPVPERVGIEQEVYAATTTAIEEQDSEDTEQAPIEQPKQEESLDISVTEQKIPIEEQPRVEVLVQEDVQEDKEAEAARTESVDEPVLVDAAESQSPTIEAEEEKEETNAQQAEPVQEFFLGPSAVEDVPSLVGEAATTAEDVPTEGQPTIPTPEKAKESMVTTLLQRVKGMVQRTPTSETVEPLLGTEEGLMEQAMETETKEMLPPEEEEMVEPVSAAAEEPVITDEQEAPAEVTEEAQLLEEEISEEQSVPLEEKVAKDSMFTSLLQKMKGIVQGTPKSEITDPPLETTEDPTVRAEGTETNEVLPSEEEAEPISAAAEEPAITDEQESPAEVTKEAQSTDGEMSEVQLGSEEEDPSISIEEATETAIETPAVNEKDGITKKLKTYYQDSVGAMTAKSGRAWGTFVDLLFKPKPAFISKTQQVDTESSMEGTTTEDLDGSEERKPPIQYSDYNRIYDKYYGNEATKVLPEASLEEEELAVSADAKGDEATESPEDVKKSSILSSSRERALYAWGTLSNMVRRTTPKNEEISSTVETQDDNETEEEPITGDELSSHTGSKSMISSSKERALSAWGVLSDMVKGSRKKNPAFVSDTANIATEVSSSLEEVVEESSFDEGAVIDTMGTTTSKDDEEAAVEPKDSEISMDVAQEEAMEAGSEEKVGQEEMSDFSAEEVEYESIVEEGKEEVEAEGLTVEAPSQELELAGSLEDDQVDEQESTLEESLVKEEAAAANIQESVFEESSAEEDTLSEITPDEVAFDEDDEEKEEEELVANDGVAEVGGIEEGVLVDEDEDESELASTIIEEPVAEAFIEAAFEGGEEEEGSVVDAAEEEEDSAVEDFSSQKEAIVYEGLAEEDNNDEEEDIVEGTVEEKEGSGETIEAGVSIEVMVDESFNLEEVEENESDLDETYVREEAIDHVLAEEDNADEEEEILEDSLGEEEEEEESEVEEGMMDESIYLEEAEEEEVAVDESFVQEEAIVDQVLVEEDSVDNEESITEDAVDAEEEEEEVVVEEEVSIEVLVDESIDLEEVAGDEDVVDESSEQEYSVQEEAVVDQGLTKQDNAIEDEEVLQNTLEAEENEIEEESAAEEEVLTDVAVEEVINYEEAEEDRSAVDESSVEEEVFVDQELAEKDNANEEEEVLEDDEEVELLVESIFGVVEENVVLDDKNSAVAESQIEEYLQSQLSDEDESSDLDQDETLAHVAVLDEEEDFEESDLVATFDSEELLHSEATAADVGIDIEWDAQKDEFYDVEPPETAETESRATAQVSSIQSRALEAQSLNLFYRFLLARGLDHWLMTIVLIAEWCRVYLLPPIVDTRSWILDRESRPTLLSNLMKTRGGAINESADEIEEEGQSLGAKERELSREGGFDEGEAIDEDQAANSEDSTNKKASSDSNSSSDEGDNVNGDAPTPESPNALNRDGSLPIPRVRPNPIYCILLGYGRVGHILIMESVLAREWIETYLPMLALLLNWLAEKVFPSRRMLNDDMAVSQTTGFVSSDGSAVRGGKKKKAQTKKEDQKALSRLQQIGDVNEAKYRFISQSFMRRHGLGQYASNEADETVYESKKQYRRAMKKQDIEQEADESDAEWIVEALTKEDAEVESGTFIEPSLGVSMGSRGAGMSVGVEFSFGKSQKKRKTSSLSDIARQKSVGSKAKKPAGPRVSDREGGVMGRIRAAGANSLVGRSIMGAYPGDAPPPNEAASASGLIELAEKYGYGEWSDDEGGDEIPRRRKRRKSQSSRDGREKRKPRSATVGVEFNLAPQSSERVPNTVPTRPISPSASETMGEVKGVELGKGRRRRKKSVRIRPAMERLRDVKATPENEKVSRRKKLVKKKSVRPAADLLKDIQIKREEGLPGKSKNVAKKSVVQPAIDRLKEIQSERDEKSSL